MENTSELENEIQILKEKLQEAKRRPNIGIGICWYNDDDEILVGKRINSKIGSWQFPGGHLEFGETFGECSARELLEEAGVETKPEEYKYITTLNVRRKDQDFHNVGIITSIRLEKDVEFKNLEPEKNEGWQWMKWEEFIKKDDLFCPVPLILEQGYTKISQFH